MKKYFFLIYFFIYSFNVSAQEIAIVDINYLLQKSKEGTSINKQFESLNKKNLKNFEKKEKELREKEKKNSIKKKCIVKRRFSKRDKIFL